MAIRLRRGDTGRLKTRPFRTGNEIKFEIKLTKDLRELGYCRKLFLSAFYFYEPPDVTAGSSKSRLRIDIFQIFVF